MNDHLAVLIYLTAARLRQQRLQAGTVGGLKFPPESHARMRREGRAEPGHGLARAHLCNDSLQQLSRVSIYAYVCILPCICGHGLRLPMYI